MTEQRATKQILFTQGGFFRSIICLAFLVFVSYSAYQFGLPFYKYLSFKSEAREILRISRDDPDSIKAQIYDAAIYFKIPVEEKDIIVVKKTKRAGVKTSWSEKIDILGIYHKTLDFSLDIEE